MAEKMDYSQGIYDAKQLGTPKLLILGAQHMFAMFGATVLVPLLTGLSVSTTLLCAGLGTLLFHFLCKGKVPAFLGSSFAYLTAISSMVAAEGTAEQIADKLQEFGVLVLGKPFTAVQFRQAVQIAASNYKRLAVLRAENAKLLDKIAQLRLVDRAKCYLIEKKGMTETEAHRLIEKGAMDTRRSRDEVAQEILEAEEEE